MTFFNDDELVDYIRNCVPLADDAGLAQLVLPRPSVKAGWKLTFFLPFF
jgi:hypothetical protein